MKLSGFSKIALSFDLFHSTWGDSNLSATKKSPGSGSAVDKVDRTEIWQSLVGRHV